MNGKGITLIDEEFLKVRKDICNKYKDYHCCECPLFEHKCGMGDNIKEIVKVVNGFEIDRLFAEIQKDDSNEVNRRNHKRFVVRDNLHESIFKDFMRYIHLYDISSETHNIEMSSVTFTLLCEKIRENDVLHYNILHGAINKMYGFDIVINNEMKFPRFEPFGMYSFEIAFVRK